MSSSSAATSSIVHRIADVLSSAGCDFEPLLSITRGEMPRIVIYADRYWRLSCDGVVLTRRDGEPEVPVDAEIVPLPVARALGLRPS